MISEAHPSVKDILTRIFEMAEPRPPAKLARRASLAVQHNIPGSSRS